LTKIVTQLLASEGLCSTVLQKAKAVVLLVYV
jgi:hypothetical protein